MSSQSGADLDPSLPLATLLRSSTARAHDEVEKSQGAGWLARGELDRDEYVRFLMMLWHVYATLERGLEQHATHPVLSFTYNPTLLFRATNLSADISHFLQTTDWHSHPLYVALMDDPPAALTRYVSRIRSTSESADPSPLLAHAYVRYLGDLSGGQIIRNRIMKAYGLEDGSGVAFYEFKPLEKTGMATMGEMKKIKEWYRRNMDLSVGEDQELKAAIIQEASIAFELNGGLFASLSGPSSPKSIEPTLPPLGEPVTPTLETSAQGSGKEAATVVYEESKPAQKTYQLSSVIAVIAAMSLAHFILVVGGFTGDRGLAKLEAVKDWLSTR